MLDNNPDELGVSDDMMIDEETAPTSTELGQRFRRALDAMQANSDNRIAALEKEVSDLKALLKEKGLI